MKIVNNKQAIRLSQLEWESFGIDAGWHPETKDLNDLIKECLQDKNIRRSIYAVQSAGMVKTSQMINPEIVFPTTSISSEELAELLPYLPDYILDPPLLSSLIIPALKTAIGASWGALGMPVQIALIILFCIVAAKFGTDIVKFVTPFFKLISSLSKMIGKSLIFTIKGLIRLCRSTPDFLSKIHDYITGGSEEKLNEIAEELNGKKDSSEEHIDEHPIFEGQIGLEKEMEGMDLNMALDSAFSNREFVRSK